MYARGMNIDHNKMLNPEEVRKLFKYLRDLAKTNKIPAIRNEFTIMFLAGTGLRNSEACNLLVKDIHIGHDQSFLVVRKGKGKKTRSVPFAKSLKRRIKKHLANRPHQGEHLLLNQYGQPYNRKSLWKTINDVYLRVGLRKTICVHSLRHLFGSEFYKQTKDVFATARIMGHSDIKTTQIYVHSNFDDLQDNINSMFQSKFRVDLSRVMSTPLSDDLDLDE